MKNFLSGRRALGGRITSRRTSQSQSTIGDVHSLQSSTPPRSPDPEKYTFFNGYVGGFSQGETIHLCVTDRDVQHTPGPTYSLLDLHWIGCDRTEPKALFVHWFKPRSSTKIMGAKMKGEMLGSVAEARDLIVVERYVGSTIGEMETILIAIECQSRSLWQSMCELAFIDRPEIYQIHVAVVKLNRKGHCQERVLVLSTSWLYNVECNVGPVSIKKAKWALPIQTIVELQLSVVQASPCLTVVADRQEMVRHMDEGHLLGNTSPPKTRHQFCFLSPSTLYDFVNEVRIGWFQQQGSELPVFQAPEYMTRISNSNQESTAVIHGYLLKHRKNKTSNPHRRYVRLSDAGVISWSEEPNSAKVLTAQILPGSDDDASESTLSFTVTTTSKKLHFVVEDIADFHTWRQALKNVALQIERKRDNRLTI